MYIPQTAKYMTVLIAAKKQGNSDIFLSRIAGRCKNNGTKITRLRILCERLTKLLRVSGWIWHKSGISQRQRKNYGILEDKI